MYPTLGWLTWGQYSIDGWSKRKRGISQASTLVSGAWLTKRVSVLGANESLPVLSVLSVIANEEGNRPTID